VFNFLQNLYIYIATCLFFVGIATYLISYVAKLIPFLGGNALLLQIIGLVLFSLSGYYLADDHGYQKRVKEDEVEIARLNAESKEKEQQVAQKFTQINTQLKKAQDAIKSKKSDIYARIDSGGLRFPTSCPVHTASDTASGDGDAGGESDRQALKDIVTLTTEGDQAITDLNACINKYNEVRNTFNKAKK
jgi:hypothetical protein